MELREDSECCGRAVSRGIDTRYINAANDEEMMKAIERTPRDIHCRKGKDEGGAPDTKFRNRVSELK